MHKKWNHLNRIFAAAAFGTALVAQAQTPSAPATPEAAPAAPAAPTWSVGPLDISGFIDAYYSYNANTPSNQSAAGRYNQLYNFNDQTNQFALNAAKLTLSHDPDPVGVHIDFLYGRTDVQMNGTSSSDNSSTKYIEQAFISLKPPKAKGFEADLGKFTTSAGAEVVETKDNWNYSRSLLYAHAVPYAHIGLRTSLPVSKTETLGFQLVNGLTTTTKNNGGVTVGLTSAYVKPKYTWNANYYVGPQNFGTQRGYENLFDTTLLLTPSAKFNAYINYDYGQNRDHTYTSGGTTLGDTVLNHWQGAALALREQVTAQDALAGRYEFYYDPQGFTTASASQASKGVTHRQQFQEYTLTYEHKWVEGLLARIEYRRDWTNFNYFTKGDNDAVAKAQSTLTAGFVAFFGPKR
jgi:hypothetical protein